jgi:hypothetical protein
VHINVFYIPWFAGLISYIYKFATSSHFKPRLFRDAVFHLVFCYFPNPHPWRLLLAETYESGFLGPPEVCEFMTSRVHQILEVRWSMTSRICEVPEVHQFMTSWIRQSLVVLKQIVDLRFKVNSAIISPDVRRSVNYVKSTVLLHEHFPATKQISAPRGTITNTLTNLITLTFWGWKVCPIPQH